MSMIWVIAYLVTVIIRPQDWVTGMVGFPIVDVVISGGLLAVLGSILTRRSALRMPQWGFLVLFLGMVYISNVANQQAIAGWEELIVYLKRVTAFVLIVGLVNTPNRLKWTLWTILILTTYLAMQSIAQVQYGVGWAGQEIMAKYTGMEIYQRVRWVGLWDGPNVLALLFVLAIPFSLEFVFGRYRIFVRLINLAISGLLITGIILSDSRGGFLALLVILMVYFAKRFGGVRGLVVGVLVVAATWTWIAPSRSMIITSEESSAKERLWLWEQGLNMMEANPLFGVGKGQFPRHSSRRLIAHNNFVSNMAETGFTGLLLYVALIYLSFKGLWLVTRAPPGERRDQKLMQSLARGLMASLIGYNVVTYFVNMELEPLFLWWGLCAAAYLIGRKQFDHLVLRFTLRDAGLVFVASLAIVFSVWLAAVKEIL